jgi:hypothetical protein
MPRYFRWLLSLLICSGTALATPQDRATPMPLLVMDAHHNFAKGMFARDGTWQGLYCNALDCEIKSAQVTTSTAVKKDVSGEPVSVDALAVSGKPVALFPGGAFTTGKVDTWYREITSTPDATQIQKLRKLGKWQMPWGARPLAIFWVKTPEGLMRYHVSDGVTKQFLFSLQAEDHYGNDTTPAIHWVGDLDGDGKLDLLLSFSDESCRIDERLYLSSHTGDGKLLRKAAQLHFVEVACGC